MREYVLKISNPSEMFIVLKSEVIKKNNNKQERKKSPDIGTVFSQACVFYA